MCECIIWYIIHPLKKNDQLSLFQGHIFIVFLGESDISNISESTLKKTVLLTKKWYRQIWGYLGSFQGKRSGSKIIKTKFLQLTKSEILK